MSNTLAMKRVFDRNLEAEAVTELEQLLESVSRDPAVSGALALDYSGVVVGGLLRDEIDGDAIASLALAMYKECGAAMLELDRGRLCQTVLLTSHGCLVSSDFGRGLLVVLSNGNDWRRAYSGHAAGTLQTRT